MKKNKKSKWILLLAVLASLFTIAGCSVGETLDNALSSRNLTAQVTYYSNGGEFEGTPDRKDMYYQDGSKALNIGVVNPLNGTATVARNNYEFDGWYFAVLDENGNPEYADEAKTTYKLGGKVDFSVPLKAGDHWQLVAKWSMHVMLQIKLAIAEEGAEIPAAVKEGQPAVSYKHGDKLQTRQYNAADRVPSPDYAKEPFEKQGNDYTFVDYYTDEACTKPVVWPIEKEEGQTEDAVIYAKYIKGSWKVLRDDSDVSDMFSAFGEGNKYYLARDINATLANYIPVADGSFNDEIQGNGYTIKGLNVTRTELAPPEQTVSLFGKIKASARIENLKLTDLVINYGIKTCPVQAYFVFTEMEAGATIKNVTLSGSMTIAKPSGETVAKRLYGGDYATDEAYLQATENNGFVVEGTAEEVIKIK